MDNPIDILGHQISPRRQQPYSLLTTKSPTHVLLLQCAQIERSVCSGNFHVPEFPLGIHRFYLMHISVPQRKS